LAGKKRKKKGNQSLDGKNENRSRQAQKNSSDPDATRKNNENLAAHTKCKE
jgi:hypothetical protein